MWDIAAPRAACARHDVSLRAAWRPLQSFQPRV